MSRLNETFRFFALIDGASLTDEDTVGTTNFFGYTRPGGSWVIMRHNETTNKYDFSLGKDLDLSLTNYDFAWTNRATTTGFARAGTYKDF